MPGFSYPILMTALAGCGAEPAAATGTAAGASGSGPGSAGSVASAGNNAAQGGESAAGQGGSSAQPGAGAGGAGGAGAQGLGGAAGSSGASSSGALSALPAEGLWTGVRYYPNGTGIDNRTSGPQQGPDKTFMVHNAGAQAVDVMVALSGPDAAKLTLTSPAQGTANIAAGAALAVSVRLDTDTSALGPSPAQDDGSTVLNASLSVSGGGSTLMLRQYALVLTYVELEPTFGQILKGFPAWTSKLPSWLPDDANPNPGSPLPGVVAETDEVNAPAFERLDPGQPVTFRPLARFSPPGVVPFGWYPPGSIAARTTVATMAEQEDPHTNDKSRLLDPPLASGQTSFEPSAGKFGVWMMPVGVGLLTSADADGFDGQHRVRSFTLRDAGGAVIPGSFLVGGEEAANGDYQDYVFVLTNVKPAP
jgi:hypothetical protein